MEKRKRSVSLSFVLFRFAVSMLGSMLLCCLVWLSILTWLQENKFIYQGYVANQQVEKLLSEAPKSFVSPGVDFLGEYALFDKNSKILESNVEGQKLKFLKKMLHEDSENMHVVRYTYENGNMIVINWHYRKEFVNSTLRHMLPPAEYVWWVLLGLIWVLCLLFNILWLRRCLATKLKLFSEVSKKVGAQELDFVIPNAGIREYNQVLNAMEHMRRALYSALSSQWAAQQKREAEIAALAHDLKTPLTLVGGNAELLLEEDLPERNRKRVRTIMASNDRAKQYVASLLETSVGADEIFEHNSLPVMFDELCQNTKVIAGARGVHLLIENNLKGMVVIQKDRLLRAFSNVVQNAIEHTPMGGSVYLKGNLTEGGWQVTVCDEGPGFSRAALQHATERLWRDDIARGMNGHNGLGLWFAAEVVKNHSGQLELCNCDSGGMVTIKFC